MSRCSDGFGRIRVVAGLLVLLAGPWALLGSADAHVADVIIYAPDNEHKFRAGCQVYLRCQVYGYQSGDTLTASYWDGYQWNTLGTMEKFYQDGSFAKFKYEPISTAGWQGHDYYYLEAKLTGAGGRYAYDWQAMRIFTMTFPEPAQLYGGYGPGHKGIDLWWASFGYTDAGVSIVNPISDAHDGEDLDYGTQPYGDGGYRYWREALKSGDNHDKIRIDFTEVQAGIPKYEEKYVFTYYAHLKESPEEYKREDNSGNASTTGSHLHFSVFLNSAPQKPNYSTGDDRDPEDYLESETFYTISGNVHDGNGNDLGGVQITVSSHGHAITYGTAHGDDYQYPGRYRVYVCPGTYSVTPYKSGWTFTPSYAIVDVTTSSQTQDFTGSE